MGEYGVAKKGEGEGTGEEKGCGKGNVGHTNSDLTVSPTGVTTKTLISQVLS